MPRSCRYSAALLRERESQIERRCVALDEKLERLVAQVAPASHGTSTVAQDAVSGHALGALQVRVHALYDSELLTEQEMHAVDDTIAECIEAMAMAAMVEGEGPRMSSAIAHPAVVRVVKLIALEARIKVDAALARQFRRRVAAPLAF